MPAADPQSNSEIIHALKNHLTIVVGFSELLLSDTPVDDPRHADLADVNKAAREAMAILPEIVKRMRQGVD
jgi:hypothetical protein